MKGGRFPLGPFIPTIVPRVPIRKKQKGGVIPVSAMVPGLKRHKRQTRTKKHSKRKHYARR